ncbi:quaternary amine ABC transporter ATP-binding protein [Alicyclobacillus shizuokensis]|uniref:quaternary amine ABC transporter ATP-binding protein n=1 Tax=Alicyclobacillus shizuokensis TaxID=392014 RepID=UPI0012ED5D26|nr:betaine/proline/choline family ABC transporter ATP-binding protein [Alicyclobacillus shizuokensis]
MSTLLKTYRLTKFYGPRSDEALRLLRNGASKRQIQEQSGCTVGIHQVDLEVHDGELFVIMGLSGSGKSTLLRCINRLVEPSAGRVQVEDEEVTAMKKPDLLRFRRRRMAMVFQTFSLFPHRTVLDNVAFGLEVQRVPKSERWRIAKEKLQMVGLEQWASHYPSQLSGGMQQRVGLARALATDADILLMDEAFSALDPVTRTEMQAELIRLQGALKKTILFITHDPQEAMRLGDRVGVMKDGELVQVGTPEVMKKAPVNDYVANLLRNVEPEKG